jgi:hypothetical protein
MWPNAKNEFSKPTFGLDEMRPSWMVAYVPILSGIKLDEAHRGIVEIDAIGGELCWLRSAETPMPPDSLIPQFSREQAESLIVSHLAATRRDPAFEFGLPVDLRIWAGNLGYKKPSRLVYRIEANGYYPGFEGHMLPKHLIKVDAITGEIVYDTTNWPGGSRLVDSKAVPLTKRSFGVLWDAKRRIPAQGSMVKSLRETKPPTNRGRNVVLMGEKGMICLTVSADRKQVFLKLADKKADKWWVGEPNAALLAALRKL